MTTKRNAAVISFFLMSSFAQAQGGATDTSGQALSQVVACNLDCVRSNAARAVSACGPSIEAQAPGDFEWVQRPFGTIFQQADTPDQPTSPIVKYRGDSIRFLDAREKWIRVIYECGYDTKSDKVVFVHVRLGVLGKVSAVPTMAAAPDRRPAPPPSPQGQGTASTPQQATASTSSAAVDLRRIGEPSAVDIRQIPAGAKPPRPAATSAAR